MNAELIMVNICHTKALIETNEISILNIENGLERMNRQKKSLQTYTVQLEKHKSALMLNLMNSVSHRRFCRMMGYI